MVGCVASINWCGGGGPPLVSVGTHGLDQMVWGAEPQSDGVETWALDQMVWDARPQSIGVGVRGLEMKLVHRFVPNLILRETSH